MIPEIFLIFSKSVLCGKPDIHVLTDSNTIVSVTEANQNFSKFTKILKKEEQNVIF